MMSRTSRKNPDSSGKCSKDAGGSETGMNRSLEIVTCHRFGRNEWSKGGRDGIIGENGKTGDTNGPTG